MAVILTVIRIFLRPLALLWVACTPFFCNAALKVARAIPNEDARACDISNGVHNIDRVDHVPAECHSDKAPSICFPKGSPFFIGADTRDDDEVGADRDGTIKQDGDGDEHDQTQQIPDFEQVQREAARIAGSYLHIEALLKEEQRPSSSKDGPSDGSAAGSLLTSDLDRILDDLQIEMGKRQKVETWTVLQKDELSESESSDGLGVIAETDEPEGSEEGREEPPPPEPDPDAPASGSGSGGGGSSSPAKHGSVALVTSVSAPPPASSSFLEKLMPIPGCSQAVIDAPAAQRDASLPAACPPGPSPSRRRCNTKSGFVGSRVLACGAGPEFVPCQTPDVGVDVSRLPCQAAGVAGRTARTVRRKTCGASTGAQQTSVATRIFTTNHEVYASIADVGINNCLDHYLTRAIVGHRDVQRLLLLGGMSFLGMPAAILARSVVFAMFGPLTATIAAGIHVRHKFRQAQLAIEGRLNALGDRETAFSEARRRRTAKLDDIVTKGEEAFQLTGKLVSCGGHSGKHQRDPSHGGGGMLPSKPHLCRPEMLDTIAASLATAAYTVEGATVENLFVAKGRPLLLLEAVNQLRNAPSADGSSAPRSGDAAIPPLPPETTRNNARRIVFNALDPVIKFFPQMADGSVVGRDHGADVVASSSSSRDDEDNSTDANFVFHSGTEDWFLSHSAGDGRRWQLAFRGTAAPIDGIVDAHVQATSLKRFSRRFHCGFYTRVEKVVKQLFDGNLQEFFATVAGTSTSVVPRDIDVSASAAGAARSSQGSSDSPGGEAAEMLPSLLVTGHSLAGAASLVFHEEMRAARRFCLDLLHQANFPEVLDANGEHVERPAAEPAQRWIFDFDQELVAKATSSCSRGNPLTTMQVVVRPPVTARTQDDRERVWTTSDASSWRDHDTSADLHGYLREILATHGCSSGLIGEVLDRTTWAVPEDVRAGVRKYTVKQRNEEENVCSLLAAERKLPMVVEQPSSWMRRKPKLKTIPVPLPGYSVEELPLFARVILEQRRLKNPNLCCGGGRISSLFARNYFLPLWKGIFWSDLDAFGHMPASVSTITNDREEIAQYIREEKRLKDVWRLDPFPRRSTSFPPLCDRTQIVAFAGPSQYSRDSLPDAASWSVTDLSEEKRMAALEQAATAKREAAGGPGPSSLWAAAQTLSTASTIPPARNYVYEDDLVPRFGGYNTAASRAGHRAEGGGRATLGAWGFEFELPLFGDVFRYSGLMYRGDEDIILLRSDVSGILHGESGESIDQDGVHIGFTKLQWEDWKKVETRLRAIRIPGVHVSSSNTGLGSVATSCSSVASAGGAVVSSSSETRTRATRSLSPVSRSSTSRSERVPSEQAAQEIGPGIGVVLSGRNDGIRQRSGSVALTDFLDVYDAVSNRQGVRVPNFLEKVAEWHGMQQNYKHAMQVLTAMPGMNRKSNYPALRAKVQHVLARTNEQQLDQKQWRLVQTTLFVKDVKKFEEGDTVIPSIARTFSRWPCDPTGTHYPGTVKKVYAEGNMKKADLDVAVEGRPHEQVRGFDLSGLMRWYKTGEPVQPATVQACSEVATQLDEKMEQTVPEGLVPSDAKNLKYDLPEGADLASLRNFRGQLAAFRKVVSELSPAKWQAHPDLVTVVGMEQRGQADSDGRRSGMGRVRVVLEDDSTKSTRRAADFIVPLECLAPRHPNRLGWIEWFAAQGRWSTHFALGLVFEGPNGARWHAKLDRVDPKARAGEGAAGRGNLATAVAMGVDVARQGLEEMADAVVDEAFAEFGGETTARTSVLPRAGEERSVAPSVRLVSLDAKFGGMILHGLNGGATRATLERTSEQASEQTWRTAWQGREDGVSGGFAKVPEYRPVWTWRERLADGGGEQEGENGGIPELLSANQQVPALEKIRDFVRSENAVEYNYRHANCKTLVHKFLTKFKFDIEKAAPFGMQRVGSAAPQLGGAVVAPQQEERRTGTSTPADHEDDRVHRRSPARGAAGAEWDAQDLMYDALPSWAGLRGYDDKGIRALALSEQAGFIEAVENLAFGLSERAAQAVALKQGKKQLSEVVLRVVRGEAMRQAGLGRFVLLGQDWSCAEEVQC